MAIGIQYSKEGKDIINKFEKLTPWDKADIIKYLADNVMTFEEFKKYFIEGMGYVDYDTIDFVQEVINNGQEGDVLDEMNDWDICECLMNHGADRENLAYFLDRMHQDDISDAINDMDKNSLYDILKSIKKNHPDLLKDIVNWLFEGK